MESTIDNTPLEASNNQILYAGFELLDKSEGILQAKPGSYNDMIIFILNGSIKIKSSHTNTKLISEPNMAFLKVYENYTYEIAPLSKILVFYFNSLTFDELLNFQAQHDLLPESAFKCIELEILTPLKNFLELIVLYLENKYQSYKLYASSKEELFYLLKIIYSKEELGEFFYLLANTPSEFEKLVAANYMNVKNVQELANIMGYGINSFRNKFKETFGIPAYQWLQNEKAKRILNCLITKEKDFKSIIDEFDFSSHSHFYKFCKLQYGLTPDELRKKIKH